MNNKEMETQEFSCNLKNLCQDCVLDSYPFQCCYQEFLLTKKNCDFEKCFFKKICPHSNLDLFKVKETVLLKAVEEQHQMSFNNPALTLPGAFIPEVMPFKQGHTALAIAKKVNAPIVAVSLQNFFQGRDETLMLRKARRYGLHKFFNYSGQILLTTDVRDRLCDYFTESTYYFRKLVDELKPDYVTTLDTYTYSNVPAAIARLKTQEAMLSSMALIGLDSKTIGLALGATPCQVYFHVKSLKDMGCKIIAYPVYELRKYAENDSIRWRLRISQKLGVKSLLLSCSAGVSSRMRVYSDYYSTWSWFSSISSKDPCANDKRKKRLQRMVELGKNCSKQKILRLD